MGKSYCSECGTELDDSAKFCSKCGASFDNKDTNNNKYTNTTKIIGIAIIGIILIILAIVFIGHSGINSSVDANDNDSDQSYIENIYGIDFSIPSYLKNINSTDMEKDANGVITCSETYERPDGTDIAIIVATNKEGWELKKNDGTYLTLDGHHGVLDKNGDAFGYIYGDKFIVISGASKQEIENITIE